MKIISGEKKGHTLKTPDGDKTRPTLSRIRESLFSIIAGDIPGSVFCELFGGCGSIALEALSRGAERAVIVEMARAPLQCIRDNIRKLQYQDRVQVVATDAFRWKIPGGGDSPDIIFADPPYDEELINRLLRHLESSRISPDALIIVQAPSQMQIMTSMQHLRTATYGATSLHFMLSATPLEKLESDTGSSVQATGAPASPADQLARGSR